MNNMYKSKNMTIKDLKKVIENLPDDMDVMIPVYEEGDETNIIPTEYCYANVAGIIEEDTYGKVFTFGTLTEVSNLSMKDVLNKHTNLIEEVYPCTK